MFFTSALIISALCVINSASAQHCTFENASFNLPNGPCACTDLYLTNFTSSSSSLLLNIQCSNSSSLEVWNQLNRSLPYDIQTIYVEAFNINISEIRYELSIEFINITEIRPVGWDEIFSLPLINTHGNCSGSVRDVEIYNSTVLDKKFVFGESFGSRLQSFTFANSSMAYIPGHFIQFASRSNSQMNKLRFSNLPNLQEIDKEAFANLTQITYIKSIEFATTALEQIPLKALNFSSFTVMDFSNNLIKSLDSNFQFFPAFETLKLDRNEIEYLNISSFWNFLMNPSAIKTISLSENRIYGVHDTAFASFYRVEINLDNNRLTSFPMAFKNSQSTGYFRNNEISTLSSYQFSDYMTSTMTGNEFSNNPLICDSSLTWFICFNMRFKYQSTLECANIGISLFQFYDETMEASNTCFEYFPDYFPYITIPEFTTPFNPFTTDTPYDWWYWNYEVYIISFAIIIACLIVLSMVRVLLAYQRRQNIRQLAIIRRQTRPVTITTSNVTREYTSPPPTYDEIVTSDRAK